MMRNHLASLDDGRYISGTDVAIVGPRETVRSTYTHDPDSHTVDLSSLPTVKTIPFNQVEGSTFSSSHSGAHATGQFASTASTAHTGSAQPSNVVPLSSGGLLNTEVIGPSDLKQSVAPGETFIEGGEESLISADMLASALPDQYGGLEYYDSEYVEGPGVMPPPPAPRPTPEPASMSAAYAAAMAASMPAALQQPPPARPEQVYHYEPTEFAAAPATHHGETLIHAAASDLDAGSYVHHGQEMLIEGEHEFVTHDFEEEADMLGGYPVEMASVDGNALTDSLEPAPAAMPVPASDPLLGEGMTLIGSTPDTSSGDGWHVTHESPRTLPADTGASSLHSVNNAGEMVIGQSGLTGQLISTARLTADGFPIAEPLSADGGNWINGGIALTGHSATTTTTTPAIHSSSPHSTIPLRPIGSSDIISTSEPMALPINDLTAPVAYAPKNFSDALSGLEDDIAFSSANAVSTATSAGAAPSIPGECHGQVVQPGSGDMVWMQILCANALDAEMVARIQTALLGAGFFTDKINGIMGAPTRDALAAYQRENNLARGEVTIETLTRLGLK